jgi:hypothetical protein
MVAIAAPPGGGPPPPSEHLDSLREKFGLVLEAVVDQARGSGQIASIIKNIAKVILQIGETEKHYICKALSELSSSPLLLLPKTLGTVRNVLTQSFL